jgi:hypothetical protein
MNLSTLRRLATDPRLAHDLPGKPDVLAAVLTVVDGKAIEAKVVANRRRSRFWLTLHHAQQDANTLLGSAETGSYRIVKEWLGHFDLDELTIAGTVLREGRCPIERVAQQPAGMNTRDARREMMTNH